MRSLATVVLVGLIAPVLVGCGQSRATVPAGAEVIHLVATASEVRLTPASVKAHVGMIFIQLDEPRDGGVFNVIQRMTSPSDAPDSLTDLDLVRIARGDTQGTSMSG